MFILVRVVVLLSNFLISCLLARCILSWFNPTPYNTLGKIYFWSIRITEPICQPFRQFLSKFNTGPFDFSALAALIAIQVVTRVVVRILLNLYI